LLIVQQNPCAVTVFFLELARELPDIILRRKRDGTSQSKQKQTARTEKGAEAVEKQLRPKGPGDSKCRYSPLSKNTDNHRRCNRITMLNCKLSDFIKN